jgi:hypothetical protein
MNDCSCDDHRRVILGFYSSHVTTAELVQNANLYHAWLKCPGSSGDEVTVACLSKGGNDLWVQCRRCWRACNTILSQQQALAKQAQKHTACLEAHDQIQNYSLSFCWSMYFCLTPVLWINRIVITNHDLWTNTSFLNSNKPRKTTTEEQHKQYDTFCSWKITLLDELGMQKIGYTIFYKKFHLFLVCFTPGSRMSWKWSLT